MLVDIFHLTGMEIKTQNKTLVRSGSDWKKICDSVKASITSYHSHPAYQAPGTRHCTYRWTGRPRENEVEVSRCNYRWLECVESCCLVYALVWGMCCWRSVRMLHPLTENNNNNHWAFWKVRGDSINQQESQMVQGSGAVELLPKCDCHREFHLDVLWYPPWLTFIVIWGLQSKTKKYQ